MSDDKPNSDEEALDKTSVVPSDTFRMRVAQAGQAPPALVLLVGPANSVGRQWSLDDTDKILGRSESSDISIPDPSISKSHAKFVIVGGDVSIIDLESTNKTVVNGEQLAPLTAKKLSNNDQVKTGNVIFKFLERGNIETVSAAQTFGRAMTDALTGINNKGALDQKAEEWFRKSDLLDAPLSLITFDIDFFKKVNDTYGHAAGDYVLQELTRVVKTKLIRENDFFARTGGEEFCLLLLGSSVKTAADIAERIRKTIEEHNFNYQGTGLPITISVGVSQKIAIDKEFETLFTRADEALYKSKRSGRNQVNVDAAAIQG